MQIIFRLLASTSFCVVACKAPQPSESSPPLTAEQIRNTGAFDEAHGQDFRKARVIDHALLAMLKYRTQYHSKIFDTLIHELTRLGCSNEQNEALAAVLVAAPIDEAFPLEFIAEATGAWCGVLFLPNQRQEESKLRLREEAKFVAKPTF
jgi:hypothetical protein